MSPTFARLPPDVQEGSGSAAVVLKNGFQLLGGQRRAERDELEKTRGYCQYWFGTLHLEAARLSRAEQAFKRGSRFYEGRSHAGSALVRTGLARVYIRQLELSRAAKTLRAALGLSQAVSASALGNIRGLLGRTLMFQGAFGAAAHQFDAAAAAFDGSVSGMVFVSLEQADLEIVSEQLQAAHATLTVLGNDDVQSAAVWLARARWYLASGDRPGSRIAQHNAHRLFLDESNRVGRLETYCVRLERKIDEQEFDTAETALATIRKELKELESPLLELVPRNR